jgi:hypothetical protein
MPNGRAQALIKDLGHSCSTVQTYRPPGHYLTLSIHTLDLDMASITNAVMAASHNTHREVKDAHEFNNIPYLLPRLISLLQARNHRALPFKASPSTDPSSIAYISANKSPIGTTTVSNFLEASALLQWFSEAAMVSFIHSHSKHDNCCRGA